MHMVNNFASSCPQCRKLLRIIALVGIRNNARYRVKYISSKDNFLSDSLSGLDYATFWRVAPPSMSMSPTPIDMRMVPLSRIWKDEVNYLKDF